MQLKLQRGSVELVAQNRTLNYNLRDMATVVYFNVATSVRLQQRTSVIEFFISGCQKICTLQGARSMVIFESWLIIILWMIITDA